MNFDNQYLSYMEYLKLGGEIQEQSPFNLLEYKAEKLIDEASFNRFHSLEEKPMELKMCVYELIGTINKYEKSDSDVTSESVGNYSITRETKENRDKNKSREIYDIINRNLSQVKVNNVYALYRGADCNGN